MQTIYNQLKRVAERSYLASDSPQLRTQKLLVTVSVILIAPILFTIGVVYILFSEPIAGLIYVGFSTAISLQLLIFLYRHCQLNWLVIGIAVLALPSHWVITIILGGFFNAGGLMLWGLAFPVVTGLIFFPLRQVIFFFIWFSINLITALLLQPQLRTEINTPASVNALIFITNVLTLSAFILAVLAYFMYQRDVAYKLLREEQLKAENLLLNILPAEIATILKDEQRVIAEHFEGASILFADVVGFTPMSAQMHPVELVNLLNDVFSYLDTLVEKYDLEKIKTIGDCYMVASGVPRPRPDHAHALVQMALDMQTYTQQNKFGGHQLNFRIGINSGPVVAGVIGRKKFIYDLWGDAVNTASRMESHGTGGIIQVSESTYALIQDEFHCEARGLISIKGKGNMAVWYVMGKKS